MPINAQDFNTRIAKDMQTIKDNLNKGTPEAQQSQAAAVADMKAAIAQNSDMFADQGVVAQLNNDITLMNGDMLGQNLAESQGFNADAAAFIQHWNSAIATNNANEQLSEQHSVSVNSDQNTQSFDANTAVNKTLSDKLNGAEGLNENVRKDLLAQVDSAVHSGDKTAFSSAATAIRSLDKNNASDGVDEALKAIDQGASWKEDSGKAQLMDNVLGAFRAVQSDGGILKDGSQTEKDIMDFTGALQRGASFDELKPMADKIASEAKTDDGLKSPLFQNMLGAMQQAMGYADGGYKRGKDIADKKYVPTPIPESKPADPKPADPKPVDPQVTKDLQGKLDSVNKWGNGGHWNGYDYKKDLASLQSAITAGKYDEAKTLIATLKDKAGVKNTDTSDAHLLSKALDNLGNALPK